MHEEPGSQAVYPRWLAAIRSGGGALSARRALHTLYTDPTPALRSDSARVPGAATGLLVYWSGVGRAGACAAAVYCGAHQSARAYRAVYYRLRDAAAPFAEEAAAPKQRPPSQPYEGVC